MKRTLTRREFLKVAGTGVAGGTLLGAIGCDRLARLPEDYLPSGGPRMNVILVIIDSLRKDHVGAYGNKHVRTPNLDALSKESLRFSQAYPESLPTLCARRAIYTGTRTFPFWNWQPARGDNIRLWGWQPIPEGQTHLAEIMQQNDYATMFVTDNLQLYKPSMNFHRGFDAFHFIRGQTTDKYKPNWTYPPEKLHNALSNDVLRLEAYLRRYWSNVAGRKGEEDWFSPQVFTRAAEFLEFAKEGQPFFLTVDNYDPHEPWDTPDEYISLYDEPYSGKEPYWPVYGPSDYLTDRELDRMKARYSAEVTMADRWLGTFLEKIEELNLFENTLLVLLSDHGVAIGEHGLNGKLPGAMYPELMDIIFLIRHPESKGAGQTSDFYASTHDVAPTILGTLGIEPPQPMQGQDLGVLLDGKEPVPRRHFTAGYHDHVWARDDDYAMFSRHDGTEAKLFDLRSDPKMNQDIAGQHPDIVKRMFQGYIIKDAGGPLPNYRS